MNGFMGIPRDPDSEAAWRIGEDRILAIQRCDEGFDCTVCNEFYVEIDGGVLENPELSILEARAEALQLYGLSGRSMTPMEYEDVMEQVFQVARDAVVVEDPLANLAFRLSCLPDSLASLEGVGNAPSDDYEQILHDLQSGNAEPYHSFLSKLFWNCPNKADAAATGRLLRLTSQIHGHPAPPLQISNASVKGDRNMTNAELNTALYKKIFAEQEAYKAQLMEMDPSEILKQAYEFVCREDILLSLEYNNLTDKQASALLKSDTPLSDVFQKWESWETHHMDHVWECVESRANDVIRAGVIASRKGER